MTVIMQKPVTRYILFCDFKIFTDVKVFLRATMFTKYAVSVLPRDLEFRL